MIDEKITHLNSIDLPYGKNIALQNVDYENGTKVLRVRVREGNRFTIFDLDVNTAGLLSDELRAWIDGDKD